MEYLVTEEVTSLCLVNFWFMETLSSVVSLPLEESYRFQVSLHLKRKFSSASSKPGEI